MIWNYSRYEKLQSHLSHICKLTKKTRKQHTGALKHNHIPQKLQYRKLNRNRYECAGHGKLKTRSVFTRCEQANTNQATIYLSPEQTRLLHPKKNHQYALRETRTIGATHIHQGDMSITEPGTRGVLLEGWGGRPGVFVSFHPSPPLQEAFFRSRFFFSLRREEKEEKKKCEQDKKRKKSTPSVFSPVVLQLLYRCLPTEKENDGESNRSGVEGRGEWDRRECGRGCEKKESLGGKSKEGLIDFQVIRTGRKEKGLHTG